MHLLIKWMNLNNMAHFLQLISLNYFIIRSVKDLNDTSSLSNQDEFFRLLDHTISVLLKLDMSKALESAAANQKVFILASEIVSAILGMSSYQIVLG